MRVRSEIELKFKDEVHDLKVTFDFMDRVSGIADWGSFSERLAQGERPLTELTKFLHYCLVEAGHRVDVDEVYDEAFGNPEAVTSNMIMIMKIVNSFAPGNAKKKSEPSKGTKKKQ